MPPAARVGDPTGHPGVINPPGVKSVLIAGQPAAVVGDTHTCSMPAPAGPHGSNPIIKGSSSVMIGGRPAARALDPTACGAPITSGASKVLIGG